MGKKRAGQQQFKGMEDPIDDVTKDLADKYKRALTKKNKALTDMNSAKDTLIDRMREKKIPRVKIQTARGDKWLVLKDDLKLVEEAVKKAPEAEGAK